MFNFEKASASKISFAKPILKTVEFTPPNIDDLNIAKVLSLSVTATVLEVKKRDDDTMVQARANFKLAYIDGDDQFKGVDYNANFELLIDDLDECENVLSVDIVVAESDVSLGDALVLSAEIEASILVSCNTEYDILSSADDCFVVANNATISSAKMQKTVSVPVDDTFMTGGDVESVQMIDASFMLKDAVVEENTVRVDGTIGATISYSENGEMYVKEMQIPISEEVLFEGADANMTALVSGHIVSSKVVLEGVVGDNIINFDGTLSINVALYGTDIVDAVSDVFMLSNEVELEHGDIEYTNCLGTRFFSERITATSVFSDNRPQVDSIIGIPCKRCYISKSFASQESLLVEGVANVDIVYKDENGVNSLRAALPFSVSIPEQFTAFANVKCAILSSNARIKAEREIEISMMFGISVEEFENEQTTYIKSAKIGAEKVQNTSGMSIYIVGENETIWDTAKALTATPDDIMEQNPALSLPLVAGDKVIYFRTIQR